jgi:hypothetical protein
MKRTHWIIEVDYVCRQDCKSGGGNDVKEEISSSKMSYLYKTASVCVKEKDRERERE